QEPSTENQGPRTTRPEQSTKNKERSDQVTHVTHHAASFSILNSQFSIRGADLPIYLAAAWWMGPLFQAIITADGARGVSPPVPTAWIGGALIVSLIALGAWHWLRRPTTDDRSLPLSPSLPLRVNSAKGPTTETYSQHNRGSEDTTDYGLRTAG